MAELPIRAAIVTVGTAATAIYTAGAASTFLIVRNIHITNETAAQITFTLGIGTTLADAGTGRRFYSSIPIAANSALDWSGFLVVSGHATTPDIIYGLASVANAATVTLSGVSGP